MTEDSITKLLAGKHAEDLFIAQCKNGPTWIAKQLRTLDAWALKRSWKPVTMIGYEIKVSRSDFLRDDKWPAYLDLCHQLYFATPSGLIDKKEVPEGVGLICATKNGNRLLIKKKAPYRVIDPPTELLIYVLMSRVIPGNPHQLQEHDSSEYWRRWLEKKEENINLSHMVRGKIKRAWDQVSRENERLERKNRELENVKRRIEELGFDPKCSVGSWQVKSRLRDLVGEIPPYLLGQLQRVSRETSSLATTIEELRRRRNAEEIGPEQVG